MTALQFSEIKKSMPADVTQGYILDMLQELTTIAQKAGLTDMASILAITVSAAQMEMNLETEA